MIVELNRTYIISLLAVIFLQNIYGQDFQWAIQSDGTGKVEFVGITQDINNDFIVVANFSNTVDVDPGPALVNFTSSGFDDILVMKFSSVGSLIWAKKWGGGLMDKVSSVAVDSNQQIVITGYFSGIMDADPGPGVNNLSSAGVEDVFLIKLDSNGNHIWSRKFGGSNADMATDLIITANHNLMVTGSFTNTVDFDPGAGSALVSSAGLTDAFIIRFDSNGIYQWVKTFGSSNNDMANSIVENDSLELYITGSFKGTVDMDPGIGTYNLSSVFSTDDVVILKLNEQGVFKWAKTIGGNGVDIGSAVKTDGNGNLILTGIFNNSVDFDPGAGSDIQSSHGGDDVFLLKLDSGGVYHWANSYGDNSNDKTGNLNIDGSNRIYHTGTFSGTVDFDPGLSTFNLNSTGGSEDIFVQRINEDGSLGWAFGMGGVGNDHGWNLTIDITGSLGLVGDFQNTMDADPGPAMYNLNSTSVSDGYLINLNSCLLYQVDTMMAACDSFLFDGLTYFNSGTYAAIMSSIEGCDSTVTLHLTIHTINTGVSQTGSLLGANHGSANYQWVYCDSMFAQVPGAFGQYFVAASNGNYAVIISDNGCVDTSACYSVMDVGVDSELYPNGWLVFPNPFDEYIVVSVTNSEGSMQATLFDVSGKIIFKTNLQMMDMFTMNMPNVDKGIYYLELSSNSVTQFYKLIKR